MEIARDHIACRCRGPADQAVRGPIHPDAGSTAIAVNSSCDIAAQIRPDVVALDHVIASPDDIDSVGDASEGEAANGH